jgi:hemerythrin-like domain-containing protein
MAARVENEQPVETEDIQAVLRFLRAFADDHHQAKEESALFPELRRTSAAQEGPLRHMLFEHDQERSLVEGLEEALLTKKGMDFVHFANRITALLRNHIQKEDNILFDIVERSLSTEQDDKVVAEFNKFKTDLAFLTELRRLEWKYLRRAA